MWGYRGGTGTPHLRVWACAVSPAAPRFSLRVSRGRFRGDSDSKRLLLMCTMSTRKEKAPDAMEKGESRAAVGGSQRGAGGAGRGRQELPSRLSKRGPGWAAGTGWEPRAAMAPSPPRPPALPTSQPGTGRAGPGGAASLAPQRCPLPRHLLSPLQPACCVTGLRPTRTPVGTNWRQTGSVPMSSAW